ncbi:uncharacterized protein LOC134542236 [Bacillus rossius redtenbacheri]|uniref:uncharacterized protein LOC134542236 n=1 Tax=Bacillus rossius redtenbacheri TaxID=93214 RepID=UPI002FDD3BB8
MCFERFLLSEAVPVENIEAATVTRAFYTTWVARFGAPLRATTDQGRQFTSSLFAALAALVGMTHLQTTANHPASNGMVERLHRTVKAAIRCHATEHWVDVLPTVLLGIRATWRDDLHSSTAKDLPMASEVFIHCEGQKGSLNAPYEGPFPILSRTLKTANLLMHGRHTTVSIDRLKPANVLADQEPRATATGYGPERADYEASAPALCDGSSCVYMCQRTAKPQHDLLCTFVQT